MPATPPQPLIFQASATNNFEFSQELYRLCTAKPNDFMQQFAEQMLLAAYRKTALPHQNKMSSY